jgi:hypothetical protein
MPDAICRTSPARSINRCEAICASAGISFSVGIRDSERRIMYLQFKPGKQRKVSGSFLKKRTKKLLLIWSIGGFSSTAQIISRSIENSKKILSADFADKAKI